MTIYIEKKSYKSFLSPRSLDSFQITSILLLIKYSTSGRASYIYLDKLYFLFDLMICDQQFVGFPKFTIPPWNIDKELKHKLIILTKNNFVVQSYDGNKVRYSLTDKGMQKIVEIENIGEFSVLNEKAKKLAVLVTTTMFEKSKVIFNV